MTDPIKATCHCGGVELRVRLSDGLNTARRCDCSYCARRGAAAVTAPLDGVEVVKGADLLTEYRWGTQTARHFFCSVCGIYTHHQRRSNPNEYGVNLAALAGVNPRDLGDIPWTDGVNHPSDR
ncbi:GFA family protein [Roseovarius sp. ZX-A-9]|uniref:GFA family protein n=1 Tax=Roseovarius sp. ZX-A-9 TaxID=3014783 RepID=UPI00232FEA1D|nr:GFA family protein [Roseovarius sp. ZX-A-9]